MSGIKCDCGMTHHMRCSCWAEDRERLDSALYQSRLMSAAEHKRLLAEIESLKAAMRADIQGAGPTTGPIYHQNIRKALGLPAEGSGADIVKPEPGGTGS